MGFGVPPWCWRNLLVRAAGGVNLPSSQGLSSPQTTTPNHCGAARGRGDGAGVEMCPSWRGQWGPSGTFSRGWWAKSPLRAAEGHCDGLHSLLELPLVRLIVGFIMETWKGGDVGAPSLQAPVPILGRTCQLLPGSALLWGWG